jgi:hypothetical protein
MSEWKHLYSEVADLEPPVRLAYRISAIAAATETAPQRSRRTVVRRGLGAAALAGMACVLVIGALAFAAHSRSPSPRGETTPGPVRVVPNVQGKLMLPAITELQQAGFAVSLPEGLWLGSYVAVTRVGNQSPTNGAKVARGTTVTLTRNPHACCMGFPGVAGRDVRMPDFRGMTGTQALEELRQMRLPWLIHVRPFAAADRPILSTIRIVGQTPKPRALLHSGSVFRTPNLTAEYPRYETTQPNSGDGPPGHDLRASQDPFWPVTGTVLDTSTLSTLPGGLSLPSTPIANSETLASAWQHTWWAGGVSHTSVVLEYPSQAVRVIVEAPTEIPDPEASFKHMANQSNQSSAYQLLDGVPALVGSGPDPNAGEVVSGVEIVIGRTLVIIQAYRPTDDLVPIALYLLRNQQ